MADVQVYTKPQADTLLAAKATTTSVTDEATARAAADSTLTTAVAGKAATSHTHLIAQVTDITAAGAALLDDADASAQRTTLGLGTAAVAALDTDGTLAANSATRVPAQSAIVTYVAAAIAAVRNGVSAAFDTLAEIATELALKAPLASPTFTGTVTVPTPTAADNSTKAASTAYVDAADALATTAIALKAPLASPALTGSPTAPTQTAADNSTKIATTAYVDVLGALKANLASPTFTGVPVMPTAAPGTNTTQGASTAFVTAAVAAVAPGLVLLAVKTASASASLDFFTRNATGQSGAMFQSDFDDYIFEFVSLLPSTAAVFWWRASTDGTTGDSGNTYVEDLWVWRAGGSALGGSATAHAQVSLIYAANSATATNASAGRITVSNPLSTAVHKHLFGEFRFHDGTFRAHSQVSASYLSTTAIVGCQILPSTGNLASGIVRCYGMRAT